MGDLEPNEIFAITFVLCINIVMNFVIRGIKTVFLLLASSK
jgi:hypothetical protein